MSDSNRGDHTGIIVAAFVTFLVISALVGYFQGFERGQADRAKLDAREHHENAAEYIETTCVGRDHTAFVECVNEAIKTSGEYQRAEHDLAAQQQMAQFANWLLAVTLITTGITGIGVYFVKRTLDQTCETNSAALAAATAANESNDIMRREQRPWVTLIREVECDYFEKEQWGIRVAWNFNIENRGKTPAHNIRIRTKAIRVDYLANVGEELRTFTESQKGRVVYLMKLSCSPKLGLGLQAYCFCSV
ncbi:MAG: hypothetical protein ABJM43_20375 [Paracoccaceae bacterium]